MASLARMPASFSQAASRERPFARSTTLPRACLSGSGRMKGDASIPVRHSTAWTTTQVMSSQGMVLGRRLKSSRLSDGDRRAPVPTRPERSKGSSATPEGTRGMEAEVPPTEGDPGQQRRGMTTAWRPSGLVRAKPPPPAPPQREASCSPATLPLVPVRPEGPAPLPKGRATWVARPSATLP
eukprot:6213933-Pleurochrysis_carterae.AAC.1